MDIKVYFDVATFLAIRGDTSYNVRVNGNNTISMLVNGDGFSGSAPIPAPSNITPVEVNGYVVTGQTLTLTPGTWNDADTLTYQWMRNGVAIAGQTGTTYTVIQADIEQDIQVEEVATNATASVPVESNVANSALDWLRQDVNAIAFFPAIPSMMSPNTSGAYGITSGQKVARHKDILHGVHVLTQTSEPSRPNYDGTNSRTFDGTDDRLELEGAFPQAIAPARTVITSVRYNSANTGNPVYSLALASSALPFVRGLAGEPSLTSGASNVRATGRGDNGSVRTVIMNSSRNPVGAPTAAPWSLRVQHSVSPGTPGGTQVLTELQPDSGTNSSDFFTTATLDRFCEGAAVTPTSFTAHINATVHATMYFSTSSPNTISLQAVNDLMTHWAMP